MHPPNVRLESGQTATKHEIDSFLGANLADLEGWREVFKKAVPPDEIEDLKRWAFSLWSYKSTEEYAIVAAIAVATLNRPDREPKRVLELVRHAGSARGLLLEAKS